MFFKPKICENVPAGLADLCAIFRSLGTTIWPISRQGFVFCLFACSWQKTMESELFILLFKEQALKPFSIARSRGELPNTLTRALYDQIWPPWGKINFRLSANSVFGDTRHYGLNALKKSSAEKREAIFTSILVRVNWFLIS